jgi:hypothetical protein
MPKDRTAAAGQAGQWNGLTWVSEQMNSGQTANWVRAMAGRFGAGSRLISGQMPSAVGAIPGRDEVGTSVIAGQMLNSVRP